MASRVLIGDTGVGNMCEDPFMVHGAFTFSGCRNYSNKKKAGSVCPSPQAQADTGRLLLTRARSVTSSSLSSCSTLTTHIQFLAKVFTPLAFVALLPSHVGHGGWGAEQVESPAS